MLAAIKHYVKGREEEGFTLIELMVVLLIIAILLAIAIPTFLGARNTANARSTQENLRNALTAEQTTWTNTQNFVQPSTGPNATMQSIEPSLNWVGGTTEATALTEGTNTVLVTTGDAGQQFTAVGWAKDGNCYAVEQSNDPAASYTGYTAWKSGGAVCAAAPAQAAPAVANNGVVQAGPTPAATWGTTF